MGVFAIIKPIVRLMMKFHGLTPQTVEIEPGTVMKLWAPSKSKAQKKPAVVFLHGFATDGIFTWMSQATALSGSYAVYVPDLLFFGGSTTDKAWRTPEDQAEFVVKGLRKAGVERCTVVGLSYGATIGFQMAKNEPEFVKCVVASDTVMEFTETVVKALLDKYGYKSMEEVVLPTTVEGLREFLGFGTHKPPNLPGFVAKDMLKEFFVNPKERAELVKGWIIPDDQATRFTITQRTYLVWGEYDKIFSSEIAEKTKEQLGGNTTLQYIKDAGHLVQAEKPKIYNEELKKILASVYTAGKDD